MLPNEFTVIVFSLQVTDDLGATGVDYITITVGEPGELAIVDIVNNCNFEEGEAISCSGEYDLSESSILECPLYEQSLTTSGVIVEYFDITPFGGTHSFTIEDANENQIEFPIIYTNAKKGIAQQKLDDNSEDLIPLFDLIIDTFSGPEADDNSATQFLITNIDYDSYVGQKAIGRLNNGSIHRNKQYSLCSIDKIKHDQKLTACYTFRGLEKDKVETLEAGDIIAIAGIENIMIGDTISDNENPVSLPRIVVDEPTVSMFFHENLT